MSENKKYRKRPVEIEAAHFTGLNADQVLDWMATHGASVVVTNRAHDTIYIDTLEGTMRADAGDWIIRGVQGEFYPCKPDIFDQTYEAVSS